MICWPAVENNTKYRTNEPYGGEGHDCEREPPIHCCGKNSVVESQQGHLDAVDHA